MEKDRKLELEKKGYKVSDDPDEFLNDTVTEDVSLSIKIQQWMMRFLQKRGWVVFYLEKQARKCPGTTCWLKLYEEELKRKATA